MQQQRKPKKEFSILKWVVFPATCFGLALIIASFNLQVFGQRDGLPYIIIVGLITFFSVCICKYTTSENRGLAIGAFCCEIFLFIALMTNAAWSLSVQRSMSVARQSQINPRELRGLDPQAQRNLSRRPNAAQTFTKYEATLFWIFVGEMALFGICYFSLWGVAQIVERKEQQPERQVFEDQQPRRAPDRALDDRWERKAVPAARQLQNGRDQSKKFDSH